MNKILFVLGVAVLSLSTAPFVLRAGAQTSANNTNLSKELTYHLKLSQPLETRDLTQILREVERQTPVTFNIEVVRPRFRFLNESAEPALSVRQRLPAGTYTVAQLLVRLKQKTPQLQWKTSQDTVNVIVPLAKSVVNPLDQRMKTSGSLALSPQQFLNWLTRQSPKSVVASGPDIVSGFLGRTDKVSFRFSKGMTLREVLNRYAQNAEYSWNAQIYFRKADTISGQNDKGRVLFSRYVPAGIQADIIFLQTGSEHRHQQALLKRNTSTSVR